MTEKILEILEAAIIMILRIIFGAIHIFSIFPVLAHAIPKNVANKEVSNFPKAEAEKSIKSFLSATASVRGV